MNPQAGNRTAVLSMTTLPSCQVRGTWNLTGFLLSPLCLKLPTHVICEKEVDCSTNQIVIFSDGTLTEKSGRDSRGLRGILAISPFKNYCWWSYFRFLPEMMDICISECQTDHAQGEEIAWSTVFLPRLWVLTNDSSFCLLACRGNSFLLCLPFLPFSQMIFPLLLDSLIFLPVENELVQKVSCTGLIVLISQW